MSYLSGIGRAGALALGALVAGLGIAVAAVAAGFGSSALILGGALAIGGVVRLMTASSAASRRARAHPADPADPRWRGGSGEVQLAGRRCVECKQRITVASEGVVCDACSEPAHTACELRHRAQAHRALSPAPFR